MFDADKVQLNFYNNSIFRVPLLKFQLSRLFLLYIFLEFKNVVIFV